MNLGGAAHEEALGVVVSSDSAKFDDWAEELQVYWCHVADEG